MKILINLININEIVYMLSQDLKLSNIIISIASHSLRYHYPYSDSYKDN